MKPRYGLVLAAALMALAACRGERPTITGSYGAGVVTGRVVVTGMANSSPAGMQVSVRGTGMTTTLAADGGFAFSGVPDAAELRFRRADGINASLAVHANEGFLDVEVSANAAKKSASRRRSASRGGDKVYEFEGLVRSVSATELVVFTSHQREETFVLDAQTVIRKGGTLLTAADLAVDDRVHVKAKKADDVLTAVLVILQNRGEDDEEEGEEGERPARKEYEGLVRSVSAAELVVFTSHQEEVTFVLNADTVIRKGGTTLTPDDIKVDDRVHVKADTAADGTKTAREVIVQKSRK